MPLRWDEVADVVAEDFTLATVPALYAERGDAGAGIDEAVGSLEGLLELSARHEAEGQGDAPWPPNYAKQAGEPPRVQPSRGAPPEDASTSRAAASAADRRRRSPRSGRPRSPPATGTPACRPSGRARARRRPAAASRTIPVIEISRAAKKDEALEGLERWKERHPEAAAALEPADVLVDGMRGRSSLWYRVRVNLIHVPEADRPAQEPLDPDYDPWEGYEWPDRGGQLERAPRKKPGCRAAEPSYRFARSRALPRGRPVLGDPAVATAGSLRPRPAVPRSPIRTSSSERELSPPSCAIRIRDRRAPGRPGFAAHRGDHGDRWRGRSGSVADLDRIMPRVGSRTSVRDGWVYEGVTGSTRSPESARCRHLGLGLQRIRDLAERATSAVRGSLT